MKDLEIKNLKNSQVTSVGELKDDSLLSVDQSTYVDKSVNNINIHQSKATEEHRANRLVLNGSDTLVITQIIDQLTNEGIRQCDCEVLINGRDNFTGEERFIIGSNVVGEIDGYIRKLSVEDLESGTFYEVGGCNATDERIAANSFELILSDHAFTHITDTVASYYDKNLKKELNHNKLFESLRFNETKKTIAIAKQINDVISVEVIFSLLTKSFEPEVMELIVESFRSFSSVYNQNKNTAIEAIHVLQKFIRRNISTQEYSVSVVYAIEAMSYISDSQSGLRAVHLRFLINMLSTDKFLNLHQDILWSSLVSLQKITAKESDVRKLSSILSELDPDSINYKVVIEAGNTIIYSTKV